MAIFLLEKVNFPSPEKKYDIDVTNDVKKLYSFNIEGVIVGKAIYDNKVDLKEILSIGKKC